MIERAILLVVSAGEQSRDVYIGDGEFRDVFDLVLEGVEETDSFSVREYDKEEQIMWLLPNTSWDGRGYAGQAISDLGYLLPFLHYGVVFDMFSDDELARAVLYSGNRDNKWVEQERISGVDHARGYDTVSAVEEKIGDIDISEFWDWEDFTTVYPMVDEI